MSSTLVKSRARSPTAAQFPISPSPQNFHSISALLNSSEMHLERRSLPSLRVAAARSTNKKCQMIDTSPIERSCSSSSTSSSRRSVSSMKQLLPFQLQPAPPLPNVLAAWLDNAVPPRDLHHVTSFESEPVHDSVRTRDLNWMRPSLEFQRSSRLQPSRYRETPVYSEPGSPQLGLAYFSETDSCSRCSPPGLLCDELCIVSDYSDAESTGAISETSFIEYTRAAASERIGSKPADTSLASFDSSQSSALSIRCQGEHRRSNTTERSMNYESFCDKDDALGSTDHFRSVLNAERMDTFVGNNTSRCSSRSNDDEIFKALTAQVATEKAHVVQVSRPVLPSVASPRSASLCQLCPNTPSEPQLMTTIEGHHNLLKKSLTEPASKSEQQRRWQMRSCSPVTELQRDPLISNHRILHPKDLQQNKQEGVQLRDPDYNYQNSEYRDQTIEVIRSIVKSFPKNMLTLDTSCVLDIRHSSRLSIPIVTTNRLSVASICSSDYLASPKKSWRFSLRRPGNTTSFFSQSKRAKAMEAEPSGRETLPTPSNGRSGSKELTASDTTRPKPPKPDLSSFQKIFPLTSDWWRGFLYAHMVAYNYIGEAQNLWKFPLYNAPRKAIETLGIPKAHANLLGQPSAKSRASLEILKKDLLSCISQLINFMLERSNSFVSTEEARPELKVDEAFIEALAEIVRISEDSSTVNLGIPTRF